MYLEQVRHARVDLTYALVLLLMVVQYLQERFVDPRIGDEPILDKEVTIISVAIQF